MTETTVNTAPTTPDASGSRLPAPGTFSLDPAHTYSRGSGTVREVETMRQWIRRVMVTAGFVIGAVAAAAGPGAAGGNHWIG